MLPACTWFAPTHSTNMMVPMTAVMIIAVGTSATGGSVALTAAALLLFAFLRADTPFAVLVAGPGHVAVRH